MGRCPATLPLFNTRPLAEPAFSRDVLFVCSSPKYPLGSCQIKSQLARSRHEAGVVCVPWQAAALTVVQQQRRGEAGGVMGGPVAHMTEASLVPWQVPITSLGQPQQPGCA